MMLRTCVEHYGNHIYAFLEENKMTEMPRVSYDEKATVMVLEESTPEVIGMG